MIGPGTDNVAGRIGRMIFTKGQHGAKFFGAKKNSVLCV